MYEYVCCLSQGILVVGGKVVMPVEEWDEMQRRRFFGRLPAWASIDTL